MQYRLRDAEQGAHIALTLYRVILDKKILSQNSSLVFLFVYNSSA